jgi:hypothetical protein
MSTRGVLDNVLSSSLAEGLNIPISLGKRRSSIEDHGFVATSISRLKLSKASIPRENNTDYEIDKDGHLNNTSEMSSINNIHTLRATSIDIRLCAAHVF